MNDKSAQVLKHDDDNLFETAQRLSAELATAKAERDEAQQKLHALRLICGTTDANKFETALDRAKADVARLKEAASRMLATWGSNDEDEIIAARDAVRAALNEGEGDK
jgi:hypothetical protein